MTDVDLHVSTKKHFLFFLFNIKVSSPYKYAHLNLSLYNLIHDAIQSLTFFFFEKSSAPRSSVALSVS